jgi:hypothetical protein
MKRRLAVIAAFALGAGVRYSQRDRIWPAAKVTPGPAAENGFLLSTGWTVRPAGEQVSLNTLPLAMRLVHGGKRMLILQSGYRTPGLSLHDTATRRRLASADLKDSFQGLAIGEDVAYGGGGTAAVVHRIRFTEDGLSALGSYPIPGGSLTGDVIVSKDGHNLVRCRLTHKLDRGARTR